MQFKKGAEVLDANDEKLGTVNRVVLDPRTREATHILVERGFLFTVDKVLPIDWVQTTSEDRVQLDREIEDPDILTDFRERHYVGIGDAEESDDATSIFWYPPLHLNWWTGPTHYGYTPGLGYPVPPQLVEEERHIPEGTIAVKEGAQVVSRDGEDMGEVERVFLNAEDNRVTHILIASGLISTERKLIPSMWISKFLQNKVHLWMDAEFIDELPDYEEEEEA